MTTKEATKEPAVTVVPMRGMRSMIAKNMRTSLDEAAQLTHHSECDATPLFEKKKQLAESGVKVSIEDLISYAVIQTLKKHPALNGRLEEKEIRQSEQVNLSIAMALPGNLLVAPALFDAGSYSIKELYQQRQKLKDKAFSNKLTKDEIFGGTFTITNLGLSRVKHFTPIINLPQLAILGVGEARKQPWVMADGSIEARTIMGLSLTFDHRAVDGAPAADFLTALCNEIESY